MKNVSIRSFFGLCFATFGPNTEIYWVYLSEYWQIYLKKTQNRKKSEFRHFSGRVRETFVSNCCKTVTTFQKCYQPPKCVFAYTFYRNLVAYILKQKKLEWLPDEIFSIIEHHYRNRNFTPLKFDLFSWNTLFISENGVSFSDYTKNFCQLFYHRVAKTVL